MGHVSPGWPLLPLPLPLLAFATGADPRPGQAGWVELIGLYYAACICLTSFVFSCDSLFFICVFMCFTFLHLCFHVFSLFVFECVLHFSMDHVGSCYLLPALTRDEAMGLYYAASLI